MRAYDESYLNDAMETLGSMLDYAVVDCGLDIDEFFNWFIASGVAFNFENGNPKYIAGMSGVELARVVCNKMTGEYPAAIPTQPLDRSPEYWTGWILAYYEWFRATRFEDMVRCGLTPSWVIGRYILHEADVSKFVEVADQVMNENQTGQTPLTRMRKLRGMTQRELAEASGVSLRMIQLYEQGQNEIEKASAATVLKLAQTLSCDARSLLNPLALSE